MTAYYDFENCTYKELLADFSGEEEVVEPKIQEKPEIESVDLSLLDSDLSNVIPIRKDM